MAAGLCLHKTKKKETKNKTPEKKAKIRRKRKKNGSLYPSVVFIALSLPFCKADGRIFLNPSSTS